MAFDDIVQQHFMAALARLPWPVSQPPGPAEAETYLTFNEIGGYSRAASNEARRIKHLVQLHAYTHSESDDHRTAFFAAIRELRKAGVKVYSYGPDQYETDTGIHHIACTCTWWQKPDDESEEE